MKKEVFDIIKILIIVFVFFYVLRLLKNLCEVDQIYESTKLIEGWNMISTYIYAENMDIAYLFSDIIKQLIIIKCL